MEHGGRRGRTPTSTGTAMEEIPFPLLALWGNKNWPTSMKVKKLKFL